ncbi:MAG: cysteine--tRNA ligase [Patescibacteria group bacterium]
MALKLHNTLTRKKEIFKTLKKDEVGLYACGPTVYWFAHVGNLRTYIFVDVLKRALEYNGYNVKHVMNITDVGHLTSDADTGEDKIEKGAKREGKTAWEIAELYTDAFKKDIELLNIKPPAVWIRATDTIKEQIDLIKTLEEKGFTYKLPDGIYFDTSKIKDYGKLAGRKKRELKAGARVRMAEGKKNITDFALWKFSYPHGRSFDPARDDSASRRQMEWDSPWGRGFPGWHTECVAMSSKFLGTPFDIHCGGIDHISIHHPNEMAQSQAASSNNLANFWLHNEFLTFEGGKMAKSLGNIFRLEKLSEKGFNPLSFRYFCLNSHYRAKTDFSLEGIKAGQNALNKLYDAVLEFKAFLPADTAKSKQNSKYKEKFLEFINDDLNTPKALALMWKLIKDKKISGREKYKLLLEFDKIFGLNLNMVEKSEIPREIKNLAKEREKFRQEKNWQKSDELRQKIKSLGYEVKDTPSGPEIKKIFL